MSSINITTAVNTSNPFLTQPHWFDDTYQADELFAHLPFRGISGPFLRINRIDIPPALALGNTGAVPVDPNAADGEDLTVPPGDQAKIAYDTLSPASEFWIKRIVGDVDLSSFLRYNFSSQNPQLGHQLAAKKLAARYEYSRMLIQGTGGLQTSPEFLGIDALAALTPSQSLTGGSDVPEACDAVISRVRPSGTPKCLVMNFNTFATYQFQLRAQGVAVELVPDALTGRMIPAHMGWPIYRSQFVPEDLIPAAPPVPGEFPATVYAMCLGWPYGVFGLFQEGIGSNGMQVEHAFSSPTRDNSTSRVAWHCSLGLTQATSLAKVFLPTVPALTPLTV